MFKVLQYKLLKPTNCKDNIRPWLKLIIVTLMGILLVTGIHVFVIPYCDKDSGTCTGEAFAKMLPFFWGLIIVFVILLVLANYIDNVLNAYYLKKFKPLKSKKK